MNNFTYFAPTKIEFGLGAQKKVGKLLKEFGAKKVLIHFGGQSAKKSGLIDEVETLLKSEGIEYVEFGEVKPNPRLCDVYRGAEICKNENIDFLLAVGGGSVIDSAKAIALAIANPDCDVWDFYTTSKTPKACAPLGVILTMAAAGSEMSEASVITKDEGQLKRAINNDLVRAKFSILNPELTLTLPDYQTQSGCADILLHTLERYFKNTESFELTDSIAEALMRTVIANAKILHENPQDLNARAEIMWASTLSHNNITGDRTKGDWSCHALEHELSGIFDVAHGAGLAAIWSTWAKYVLPENPKRFARLAINVAGVENNASDPVSTALKGIEKFEEFFASVGMPTRISHLGIEINEDLASLLAKKCSNGGTQKIGKFRPLDESDMKQIYLNAK